MEVKNGWHGSKEVNHVSYKQEKITKEEIVAHLKRAGTYIETISDSGKEQ